MKYYGHLQQLDYFVRQLGPYCGHLQTISYTGNTYWHTIQ